MRGQIWDISSQQKSEADYTLTKERIEALNIQEYIESGILELYAMGALPSEEAEQVARDIAAHPELRQELEAISRTLEEISPIEGRGPSASLRDRVLAGIEGGTDSLTSTPSTSASNDPPRTATVHQLPEQESTGGRRYLLAASFIAFLLSSSLALWLWTELDATQEELAKAEEQRSESQTELERVQNQMETLRNYDNRMVRMVSTGKTELQNPFAVLYWNPETQTVWIDAAKMPPLPEGKQYQLWAIDEGDPVDAGVFDGATTTLQELKNVNAAKIFAVTIEPKGGSPTPTLETMAVSGAIDNS